MYNLAHLWLHYVFSSHFMKQNGHQKVFGINFVASGRQETHFAHSPLSKQHSALTMATAMSLCLLATCPKHQNSAKMSSLLHFSGFTPAMGEAFYVSQVWASVAAKRGKITSV